MPTRPRIFLPTYAKKLPSWLPFYFVSKGSMINATKHPQRSKHSDCYFVSVAYYDNCAHLVYNE